MVNVNQAAFALATLLSVNSPTVFVKGHGYLASPRSRNYYAHDIINTPECTGNGGCPREEYCHHCLNVNDGACGKSSNVNYDTAWLDKSNNPMPWRPQGMYGELAQGGEYSEGGFMVIDSYLYHHHLGHMEIRACALDDSNPSKCTDLAEFEGKELHFIEDMIHPDAEEEHDPMPADPNYPERGYYSGTEMGALKSFRHLYRLPMGVSGKVLLSWQYITANSCSPPGYADYFVANGLQSVYYKSGLTPCAPREDFPNDGTRSDVWPERFYNCAEVEVLPDGTTVSSVPTISPTTASPTVSESPTKSPVSGPPPCLSEWESCTAWDGCCDGLVCRQVELSGLMKCLATTCVDGPTPYPPTPNPPSPPTPPAPTPPTGDELCYGKNSGYQTPETRDDCNQSVEFCENSCVGLMLTGPIVRDGCCTWNGDDCSSVTGNAGCQYLQSDCESCDGSWQLFA